MRERLARATTQGNDMKRAIYIRENTRTFVHVANRHYVIQQLTLINIRYVPGTVAACAASCNPANNLMMTHPHFIKEEKVAHRRK